MHSPEKTILVVDDVEENRVLVSRLLARLGYRVLTASDGREVMALIGKQKIDLVILDINMPFVDGITVLKQIRSFSRLSDIPVVMLTALDDRDTTLECIRIGACGYVTKPFNLDKLQQQIENCLK